jgi:uncharacterized RDD family membrane protein YckC
MTMSEQLGGAAPYASVGRRIGTWLLDGLVTVSVLTLLGLAPALLTHQPGLLTLGLLAVVLLGVGQWWLMGTRGFTIGKVLLGTRVVDADTGAPIGMARALLRSLVLGVLANCSILLIVVAVLAGKDPRRQGWHDKAARSVEVEAGDGGRTGAGDAVAETRTPPPPASSAPHSATAPPPVPAPSPAPVAPPPFPGPSSAPVAPPPAAPLPAGGLVAPPPGLVTPPPRAAAPMPGGTPGAGTLPPAPGGSVDEATRRPGGDGVSGPRPLPQRWVLRPRAGSELVVAGTTVVGRDPDTSQHPFAVAWRVDDPVLTVSKTHALVTLASGTPWIEDLDSTHGVVIRRGGDEMTLDPRTPARLLLGDVVILGAFEITVEAG